MIVFHFHDHWHRRRPTDGIAEGMARELGWQKYAAADNPRRFKLEPMSLRALAEHVKSRLHAATLRVVGDPDLQVSRVAASWGYSTGPRPDKMLAEPDVDVVMMGETREWETVEYAQDIISSGKKKALIVIGHVASEQAGMKLCAEWLRGFVTEVPVEFIVTPEPFWSPGREA